MSPKGSNRNQFLIANSTLFFGSPGEAIRNHQDRSIELNVLYATDIILKEGLTLSEYPATRYQFRLSLAQQKP